MSNIIHDNSNNLSLEYHSVKNSLYTWHSNVHSISVDFFGPLAKGGIAKCPPPVYTLVDSTCNVKYNHYKIRLTRDAKQDLKVWEVSLDSYNGVTIITEPILASSAAINLFTDASHRGYGGTYGSQFICGQFPERWKNFSITIIETYPILALLATFAHKLKNLRILFNCDNWGVVHIINKQSSKIAVVMNLVRPLVTILLTHIIRFTARHVTRKKNVIYDMLSRRQVKKEELLSCGLAKSPTPIPGHMLPQNLL